MSLYIFCLFSDLFLVSYYLYYFTVINTNYFTTTVRYASSFGPRISFVMMSLHLYYSTVHIYTLFCNHRLYTSTF